jgi:hypothetical protein
MSDFNWGSILLIFLSFVFLFFPLIGMADMGFLVGFCLGAGVMSWSNCEKDGVVKK